MSFPSKIQSQKKMEFPSKFRKLGILNSKHLFILSYKAVILEIQYPPTIAIYSRATQQLPVHLCNHVCCFCLLQLPSSRIQPDSKGRRNPRDCGPHVRRQDHRSPPPHQIRVQHGQVRNLIYFFFFFGLLSISTSNSRSKFIFCFVLR